MNIFLEIVLMVAGFFLVWKEPFFHEFIGQIDWAERKLGMGGTRTLFKLIGIGMMLLGLSGLIGLV